MRGYLSDIFILDLLIFDEGLEELLRIERDLVLVLEDDLSGLLHFLFALLDRQLQLEGEVGEVAALQSLLDVVDTVKICGCEGLIFHKNT